MDFTSDTVITALRLPALILSLSFHEFAHAWAAHRMGDDTAHRQGRLTLNPLAHLSLWGTLFIMFGPFGWAKPVPFNPQKLPSPVRDSGRVALAGPLTNLMFSGVAALLFILLFGSIPVDRDVNFFSFVPAGHVALQALAVFLRSLVLINLVLAVFNLLPIPPLDGGHILQALLPQSLARRASDCASSGAGLLVLLILIFSGALQYLFFPFLIILLFLFALGPIPILIYLTLVAGVGIVFFLTLPKPDPSRSPAVVLPSSWVLDQGGTDPS